MEDEQPQGELGWFAAEVRRSLTRPRAFARSLAREHYGLAGVLVALFSGAALSLAVDVLLLASRNVTPLDHTVRILGNAALLGVRLAVSAAVVAAISHLALRALRRAAALTLDQLFTALTFALAPLLVAPLLGALVALVPEALPVAGAAGALLGARLLYGLALNLAALLPRALAAVALGLVLVAGGLLLIDQVSRIRFVVLAYAPTLAPPLRATPATGIEHAVGSFALTLPARWQRIATGLPGEAGRFTTDTDVLVVQRARGSVFLTADSYADTVGGPERRGMTDLRSERDVVRAGELVLVDDRAIGRYEGRRIVLRLFTTVAGTQALALVFRYIEPADEGAALAEAATIAATWRLRD